MSEYIQIFVSFPSKSSAGKISKQLLKERLVACIQIFPINSAFWWQGKIENAKEWLCIIKTKKRAYKKIEKLIKQLHSYSVPEIISFEVQDGNKDYLKWISEVVK
jgi:periplasmic divalent cation tolerance protein